MSQIRRHPERAASTRAELDAILDASWTATLSTVDSSGHPLVVPLMYARQGDRLILHGSTGAGALRAAAMGRPVAVSVTLLDGFVYADSLFDSSANYRSAVVSDTAYALVGAEATAALEALSDHLLPGRREEIRPSTTKELAATLTLALDIRKDNWTAKCRSGPPSDPPDAADGWCGVLPVETRFGAPVPGPGVAADAPVPESVRRRVESATT